MILGVTGTPTVEGGCAIESNLINGKMQIEFQEISFSHRENRVYAEITCT